MFYGVEQSTDLRCPNTVIKRFSSINALRKWMENSGGFTHSDPERMMNYHHTFRYGYELKGRIDRKDSIFKDTGSPTYPRNDAYNLSSYLWKYGTEVLISI